MEKANSKDNMLASQRITAYIAELEGWRGKLVAHLRKMILEADPKIVEEWKWGTAVWSHNGNVVAVAALKEYVKLNFFKGASLKDPHKLFNAGLDAKVTRAIDIYEHDKLNEAALRELLRIAVAQNTDQQKTPKK